MLRVMIYFLIVLLYCASLVLGYTGDDRICCSSYLWYLLPLQKIPLIFIEVMDIALFTFTNSLYLLFMCESVLQESFWGDGEWKEGPKCVLTGAMLGIS